MAERRRVEIGMGIGQVVSARLDDDELKSLRHAVESGEGTLVINVKTVIFMRIPDQGASIGFSQG
jgi:hypothetical protein